MNPTFAGPMQAHLDAFLQEKQAVGFPYQRGIYVLQALDRFCVTHYPDAHTLTRPLVLQWAERRPGESVNTLTRRLTPIRQLAKFLNGRGIPAYVLPAGLPGRQVRYVPHIYTSAELTAFFQAADQLPYDPHSPVRHWVIPVIFRLVYCCGLRRGEAVRLTVDDVDLTTGTLHIRAAKGRKDRRVPLAPDVWGLCRTYDAQVRRRWPNRSAFFPNPRGGHYHVGALDYAFHAVWARTGLGPVLGNPPRVHDFRHSFAVHRLNQWIRDQRDVAALLPYLTIYLGHAHLSETDYYLHLVPEFFPVLTAASARHGDLIPAVIP
jgi:integrase/recombinase XerD